MKTPLFRLLLALMLSILPPLASGQASPLQFSGFATLGSVWVSDDNLRFVRDGINHPGNENPDFSPDTVAGLQANLRLGDTTRAVLQIVSRETPHGDYTPHPTLAFLGHTLTPALTVRAGRMRIPFFMLSDSIDINYANLWVRPPVEVYGLNPFADLDGIDFLYRTRIGRIDLELHPYAGSSSIPLYDNGASDLRGLFGLNIAAAYDGLSIHLGHGQARIALFWDDELFRLLAGALHAAGLDSVTSRLSGDSGYARFDSAGFQWDNGDWRVIGEYVKRQNTRYANSAHGWYLTVGHRFGAVTPFLTFARQKEDSPVAQAQIPYPALAAAFNAFLASRNLAQDSATIGLRWDFSSTAALKTEFMHVRTDSNAKGTFFPSDPLTADLHGQTVNVLSLSLDLTF